MRASEPHSIGRSAGDLSRFLILALVVLTTAFGAAILWTRLDAGGIDLVEGALIVNYAVLILWIASSFWFCFAGAMRRLAQRFRLGTSGQVIPDGAWTADGVAEPGLPNRRRIAVLMPIYNESADRVFAALRAVYESLRDVGALPRFDFYVLSDSTEPEAWVWEANAWLHTTRELNAANKLFYRRRGDNSGRKAGNIAEFCQRWGGHYEYMAVLDADSLMDGRTLVEMERRMDADPKLGLLQAWPRPVRGRTLFARMQQFSASLVGRLVVAGLSWLSSDRSTYWGHNAMIRVRAFAGSCGLPRLPGRPPFGGEILSHDFVEAALLVRAGWRVRIDSDLGGSFEESPPNLLESLSRDRRWCQGNMQHIRILFSRGLHWMSRLNLLIGIMSFLSAPLWLSFVALTLVEASRSSYAESVAAAGRVSVGRIGPIGLDMVETLTRSPALISLLTLAAILLVGPKLMAYLLILSERDLRRGHGGAAGLTLSLLIEVVLSALAAPVLMAMHARFVAEVLAGRAVKWSAQQRDADRVRWRECVRAHWSQTALGLCLAAVTAVYNQVLFWWLSPVLVGLLTAVPLSYVLGQAGVGSAMRRAGLLLTREEQQTPPVIQRAEEIQRTEPALQRPSLSQAVADPWLNAAHLALTPGAEQTSEEGGEVRQAMAKASENGLASLRDEDWKRLLANPRATEELLWRAHWQESV